MTAAVGGQNEVRDLQIRTGGIGRQLAELARQSSHCQRLLSVPGIGLLRLSMDCNPSPAKPVLRRLLESHQYLLTRLHRTVAEVDIEVAAAHELAASVWIHHVELIESAVADAGPAIP